MNAAYFIDFNNTDVSENEMSEKHLKDDVSNKVNSQKLKKEMSRMKSMSIQNINIDDHIFCQTKDSALHSSSTDQNVYRDIFEDPMF